MSEIEKEHLRTFQAKSHAEELQESMLNQIERVKADLKTEIAQYEQTEQEMKQLESLDQLRQIQMQLWHERKNLYLLN